VADRSAPVFAARLKRTEAAWHPKIRAVKFRLAKTILSYKGPLSHGWIMLCQGRFPEIPSRFLRALPGVADTPIACDFV
jgi:hypothetical protein